MRNSYLRKLIVDSRLNHKDNTDDHHAIFHILTRRENNTVPKASQTMLLTQILLAHIFFRPK